MQIIIISHRALGIGKVWQQILTTALHGSFYYIIVPFLQMRNLRLSKEPNQDDYISSDRESLCDKTLTVINLSK